MSSHILSLSKNSLLSTLLGYHAGLIALGRAYHSPKGV